MKKTFQRFNTALQDSYLDPLSQESETLPLGHCTLQCDHTVVVTTLTLTLYDELGTGLVCVESVTGDTCVFASVEDVQAGDGEGVVHVVLEDPLRHLVVYELVIPLPPNLQILCLLWICHRSARELCLRSHDNHRVQWCHLYFCFTCGEDIINNAFRVSSLIGQYDNNVFIK